MLDAAHFTAKYYSLVGARDHTDFRDEFREIAPGPVPLPFLFAGGTGAVPVPPPCDSAPTNKVG